MTPREQTNELYSKIHCDCSHHDMNYDSGFDYVEKALLEAEADGWKRGMEEAAKIAKAYSVVSSVVRPTAGRNIAKDVQVAIETSIRGEAPIEKKEKAHE